MFYWIFEISRGIFAVFLIVSLPFLYLYLRREFEDYVERQIDERASFLRDSRVPNELEASNRRNAMEARLELLSLAQSDMPTKQDLNRVRKHLGLLSIQLGAVLRMQQISTGIQRLRVSAATARFALKGETGYVPDQLKAGGVGYSASPTDESEARLSVLSDLEHIEDTLDELVGQIDWYRLEEHDEIPKISSSIDSLRWSVQYEARNSEASTLNKIYFSALSLSRQADLMQQTVNEERRERESKKHNG